MKTQVTFRHVESSPALHDAAVESIKKFERFFNGITAANAEFISDNGKTVEFTVQVQGNTLVSKESSEDFTKSINLASDKMIRQIKKWKTKTFKTV